MILRELRARTWAACAFALAAPFLARAESGEGPPPNVEQQLVQRITEEQSVHGPHSPLLVETFMDLGRFYEEGGFNAAAVAAYTEARGVIRAIYGLSSLEELPALEAVIRTQEAIGYVEEPWRLEHELLDLARAHPDDLRVVAVYREIGDKRMEMLDRYLAGEFLPQLALGCYYQREEAPSVDPARQDRSCTAGSRSALIRAVAKEAWGYYYSAIRILLEQRLYASTELHDLETEILKSAYKEGAYEFGRASLRRSLSYDVASGEPLLARIESLLQMADWDIVTTHARRDRSVYGFALDAYRQAYAELTRKGVDRRSIDALFSPEVPIVLPRFVENPFVSRPTDSSAGYIDVTFDITKFGYGTRIEILDTTTNRSRETRKALVHAIAQSVFRPRMVDGQIDDARVVMRYYVKE